LWFVRFGLAKEELKDVDELLEEVTQKVHNLKPQGQAGPPRIPLVSLLGQYIQQKLYLPQTFLQRSSAHALPQAFDR